MTAGAKPLKILHTSDHHWDDRGRIGDLRSTLSAMLDLATEEQVDLIVHAGDFFERRSSAAERTELAEWLQAAADIAPVYGVRGNHDVPGDLEVFNRLKTRHPIHIEERATARPGSAWEVDTPGGRVACLGLAWVEKANVAAQLESDVDMTSSTAASISAVRQLLVALRAEATRARESGAIPLLVAHAMIGGSILSNDQPLIGQGIELSAGDLFDTTCDYVALGHIHREQSWCAGRIAYSGSPVRHNFGEASEPKGCRVVEIEPTGRLLRSQFVELPAREIALIEWDWTSRPSAERLRATGRNVLDDVDDADWADVALGALVRVRYRILAEDRHLASPDSIEKAFLAHGAHEVKVEPIVVSETRARAPELADAESLTDKLDSYINAKSLDVSPEQLERLHTKLASLQGVQR